MAYFQAKRHWERQQNSENKNFRYGHFPPDLYQRIKKKQQKNSKNYKTPIWPPFRPKQVGKG